ncbi:PAS domain S-box-containing protein [Trinickia symbiotica]|nr:ATP-binding protein [Trinickia symbiotica]PPK41994.1 PAS domain S-box-containing protein [Trinickia symbiotica]
MKQSVASTVDGLGGTFLAGGEMGERIRAFDWSQTPVGAIEAWSPALRTTVRIMLANRFPHILWWGPEYIQFYNDAYRPIPGKKHPAQALGRPASECWQEIWHIIGPLIDRPFRGGPATWDDDIFLEINRYGFVEESHFTIAYSPVPDDTAPGGIGGVLATVHEITEQVVGERRIRALRDLAARGSDAKTVHEACAIAARTMGAYDKDLPFVLLYILDPGSGSATLAGAAGIVEGDDVARSRIDLEAPAGELWPVHTAMQSDGIQVVEHLAERFAAVPPGPWSDPPEKAVVIPIPSSAAHEPVGFMVTGISSRLKWDEHYRDFLSLVVTQIATAIANARAYEVEKQRAEALAKLNRAKTAFLSNVSHEFRTPLTLMLGPIEDLLSRAAAELSPGTTAQLEIVNRNGLRLLRLVNSLLDFSRIEAGRMQAIYEPTDLAAYTADLASVFRSACERAGLKLRVDCPPLATTVSVDRGMWEKIVLNLISNAFKFTFEGEIVVTLRQLENVAELHVRDTGTGIPADELPHLFERFHRIENARGRTYEGSGIGLALTKELVKLHGGEIRVESRVGDGSTFVVTVPIGRPRSLPDPIDNAPAQPGAGKGARPFVEEALGWLPDNARSRNSVAPVSALSPSVIASANRTDKRERPRVLAADDNADMREYLTHLLAEHYEIEVVPDGAEALAVARARPPDLVLTDVMMPKLDGFGLLRALRTDPKTARLPVIMLSARAGEESRIEGMEAGADDYLIKPFSARELIARVGAHLQISRLRLETDEVLRQRAAQFKTLLDQAPLGVYLVDSDFRIREVNPVALPVFGNIPGGVIGRDFDEILRILWGTAYADEVVGIFRHTLATGEPFVMPERAEFRIDRGVWEYYEWRINRIPLPDGRQGVVCYFRDISEQVITRKMLEENREALKIAARQKDDFLAMLAHELRGPLAPLANTLEILRRSNGNEASVRRAASTIERQLTQLVRLVDDLLDASRISRDKLQLRKEIVELEPIVRQAIETCRPSINRFQHALTVTLPSEPVYLNADPARLVQVLVNLLNNACKYTEQGGQIWLTAARQGGDLIIRLKDSGVGISSDELPKVFELFVQVDRSLERAQGGLGIGLALVKRLVEMHGGTVAAVSDGPGRGSEFVVRLPALALEDHSYEGSAQTSEEAQPKRCILVVDDDPDSAASLAVLLELTGNVTYTAGDGIEAVREAQRLRPDVILLDIGLPKFNGYEAARLIRETEWGRDVMLIALTGWGQDDAVQKSKDAGFDAHIVKPAKYAELMLLLSKLSKDGETAS